MCNLCYACDDPNLGLALSRNDTSLKCYMGDTGLLVSLAFSKDEIASSELYRKITLGSLSLNEGMLHENLVAQTIASTGRELYFYTHYSAEKHRNDIEVDFLILDGSKLRGHVIPIEVKSSKNYSAVSHEKFKKRFDRRTDRSIIVHPKAFSATGEELRLPTYMFFCALEQTGIGGR